MRSLKIERKTSDRGEQSLEIYLQEIGKYNHVSAEEEALLAQKIREGDKEALEKLVKANLKFVVSVAKQYQNQGLLLQDIINEGNLGLIKAAEKFDERRGFKFISYAVWRIRQGILLALADHARTVRLPLNKISDMNKIKKARDTLEKEYEREATVSEIAEYLDIKEFEVNEIDLIKQRAVSIDKKISDDAEDTYLDFMPSPQPSPDSGLIIEGLKEEINDVLNVLVPSSSEKIAVKMSMGIDQGAEGEQNNLQIGAKLGCTEQHARQLKKDGKIKLENNQSITKKLRKYLG